MKLSTLREVLIYKSILADNSFVDKKFVDDNYHYLKKLSDESINETNKYILEKNFGIISCLLESLMFIIIFLVTFKLKFGILNSLIISGFITINFLFFYCNDFIRFLHKLFVKKSFRLKIIRKGFDKFGYNFAYIGTKPGDGDFIVVTSALNPPNIKLDNPVIYLVSNKSLYSVILDYKSNPKSKNLDDICLSLYSKLYKEKASSSFINDWENNFTVGD